KIFEAGLPDLGLAPPSLDQLVMGDMRRTRFGTIKALIILGAKDGALPARPADAGLLSDDDRAALASGGLKLAMDSTAKINEEEFLIYANISKPTEFLAISFPAGDLEGKGANPARLVNRVRELFPELGVPLPLISNKHKAFTDLTLALGKRAASGAKVEPHLLDAYAYFAKDEEFSQKIAAMKGGLEFSNANHALKKLGKRDIRTSVTRLQKYISCPFAYFAEFNLHAKKRKIHEVGALDMGNIYHDILSKFGEALKSLDAADAADEGKVADIISASVDAVFDDPSNEKLGSSGRYKHFASKMRLISQRSADALAKHLSDGKFSLTYNEVAFGVPQKDADYYLPPIEIELSDNAKMLLEGRIDRVDVGKLGGADYVKIIDYKSGRKQFSLEEVYYGLDMQLLVYLGAFVSQIATNRGEAAALKILPAAAFYFNLLNPLLDFDNKLTDPNTYKKKVLDTFKMSGIVLDDDEVQTAISQNADSYKKSSAQVPADTFARLLDHVMHLAKSAGEDILAGFIPISPYKHRANSPCTHCDYHPICKFDDTTGQRTARPLKALTREEIINSLS
ncbi:MAG: PD-(D/E)XK nuclease family protein, partial [Defluviitaleaceae bacterium]|nr:PD-(D/E)XK nuclease family protein [Defluviitaleaceae bacterium]